MVVASKEAVKLFHEASIALARVEAHGINIDCKRLHKTLKRCKKNITALEDEMKQTKFYRKKWRKVFGSRSKLTSNEQWSHMLFEVEGLECRNKTATGKASASEDNIQDFDLPIIKLKLQRDSISKVTDALKNIERHLSADGRLRPNVNLNKAASFRSTYTDINFQNVPIRDDEQAKLIRPVIIASRNCRIIEADFSGVEVAMSCPCHNDKKFIQDYLVGDMHRDMSIEIFKLQGHKIDWKAKAGKAIRNITKNKFVFPQFYGDYWVQCAKNIWTEIERLKPKLDDKSLLLKHLKSVGLGVRGACERDKQTQPGTFEYHLKQIEESFWNVRYAQYTAWKKSTWEEYKRKGYCKLKTGFVCYRNPEGQLMNRKQVINYQIQGPAFHCLLWVLVQVDKWLRENKLKTRILGQIHDSLLADVHKNERDYYIETVHDIMTVKLRKHWDWINVPLRVELEETPINGSWYEKQKIDMEAFAA